MKRIFSLMLLAVVASVASTISAGTPISQAELPKTVKTFLAKHFRGDAVVKAEKESSYRGTEYEVDLKSGAEVDFRSNGDWDDIKAARGASVPSALVPKAIAKYVTSNYHGQRIVEISRERGGYEVELADGTELHLTKDGRPLTASRGNTRGRH